MIFRPSVTVLLLTVLILVLTTNAFGQVNQNSQERNIFFNREHYNAEQQEAKEKAVRAAEQICPNHTQEIQEKLEEFKVCSEKIDENEKTMCEVIEENFKSCAVPIFDLFERCVPLEAKGLPTYVLKTTRAIIKYICNTDGAHLLEFGNPCILRKNHPDSRICIRKLKKEAMKYDFDNLPEKKLLCMFLKDFRSCFKSHVENSCQDPTTREAYIGFYDTFLCK